MLRALVAAQQHKGKMVPGAAFEDAALGLQLLADDGLKNRAHFLNGLRLMKEVFDLALAPTIEGAKGLADLGTVTGT